MAFPIAAQFQCCSMKTAAKRRNSMASKMPSTGVVPTSRTLLTQLEILVSSEAKYRKGHGELSQAALVNWQRKRRCSKDSSTWWQSGQCESGKMPSWLFTNKLSGTTPQPTVHNTNCSLAGKFTSSSLLHFLGSMGPGKEYLACKLRWGNNLLDKIPFVFGIHMFHLSADDLEQRLVFQFATI